jgi:hypothetical protein
VDRDDSPVWAIVVVVLATWALSTVALILD